MTDLQTWQAPQPPSVTTSIATGTMKLVDWAQEADAAYSLAQRFVDTAFCPEQFRGKPAEAAVAMLAGGELGLSPIAAMGAFDVIQGRAAPRAITLRAVTQARGHEIVMVESTNTRCRMKGRRAGSSEWQSVSWTIERANDLKLTGKDNWRKQPGTMLVARATSEICRLVASDAILGLAGGYSSEEVADGSAGDQYGIADAADTQPEGTRRMGRKRPQPEPEVTVEQVTESAPADEPTPDPDPPQAETGEAISSSQLKKIGALMREVDLTDRTAALAYVSRVVGRDVASRNDLTKREASDLIDALDADKAALPTDAWGPQNNPDQEDQR